jgi:hypothetical protein
MHPKLAVGLAAATLLAPPAAAAAQQSPTRSEPATHAQALEALRIRGEALNRLYGDSRTAPPSSPSEGFDWTDAGLGASGGFALALFGGACALTIRRRSQRLAAHP